MTLTLRTSFAALAVGLLVVGTTACGTADGAGTAEAEAEAGAGSVTVDGATIDWPANPKIASVAMVIRNGTGTDDSLVGVTSPVARRSIIHRSDTDEQGRAIMTAQDRVPLPARSSVTFEPGGLHVMLTGITDDLQVGDPVRLTLSFEHAEAITSTARVVEPGTATVASTEGRHGH